MTIRIADRVEDLTTTTGTGTLTLAGTPPTGARGFDSVLNFNDTTYYCIEDTVTGDWEVGLGTYPSVPSSWGIVGWWDLENTSDSVGSFTLTNHSSVTFTSGKIGNAATFSDSNYLSVASASSLQPNTSEFWSCCWVNLSNKSNAQILTGKYSNNDPTTSEWVLYYDNGADRFACQAYNGVTAFAVVANNFGSPSTGTWYFIAVWYDRVSNFINMSVNNGSANSTACSVNLNTTSAAFGIGASGDDLLPMTGQIDSVQFAKAPTSSIGTLIPNIISSLYNSGNGQSFPGSVGMTLQRTTVLASSNSGSLVSFGSGNKNVFLPLLSEVTTLTSKTNTWTAQQYFPQATLTDATTISWNANIAQAAIVTLGGNRTLALATNIAAGGTYTLIVKQDSGGNKTLAYASGYKFTGGSAPTLSTGANAIDILSFTSDGTSMFGFILKAFS